MLQNKGCSTPVQVEPQGVPSLADTGDGDTARDEHPPPNDQQPQVRLQAGAAAGGHRERSGRQVRLLLYCRQSITAKQPVRHSSTSESLPYATNCLSLLHLRPTSPVPAAALQPPQPAAALQLTATRALIPSFSDSASARDPVFVFRMPLPYSSCCLQDV